MRKIYYTIILFVFFISSCGQKENNDRLKHLSKEEIEKDFDQLTKIIETNVPTPFYSSSKSVYDSLKKAISIDIPNYSSVKEVYKLFYPLVQTLNDAHFSIHLPDDFFSDSSKYFPLKVIIQGNKLFIKENLSVDKRIQNGDEIVKINSVSVKNIIDTIRSCNFKSASEELFFEKWNEDFFYKRLAALFNTNSPFDIEMVSGQHFKISGIYESLLKKDAVDKKEPSFKILDHKIGYLIIPSLDWNTQDGRIFFDKKIDSAFSFFQSNSVSDLVIDIRDNMGGSTLIAKDVLDYIYFKPYTLGLGETSFKNGVIKENTESNLHTPILHSNCFKGKTILLNNVLTYSSGHMMQVGFQYYKMGKTIGEKSSEPLFITGEVHNIVLKNSGLQFYYGTSNFILPGFNKARKTYYVPDVVYTPTIKEQLDGGDILLKKAIATLIEDK